MTEGERWAAELLEELRSARFTPRAWIRFLARSFTRARERRRERQRAHRQVLALGLAGLGAWTGLALAGRPGLAAAGGLWWLAVSLMLDWHLGMLERPDGRPLAGLGTANLLSLLRVGFVPVLPTLSPPVLGITVVILGVTDVLDGLLARARDEVTRLGFWLDGSVDSLLLGVAAFVAARAGVLPGWIALLVVVRYGLPWLIVAVAYFVRAGALPLDGAVSGRLPGLVLLSGFAAVPFWPSVGAALAAAGALGGLATLTATVVRSLSSASDRRSLASEGQ